MLGLPRLAKTRTPRVYLSAWLEHPWDLQLEVSLLRDACDSCHSTATSLSIPVQPAIVARSLVFPGRRDSHLATVPDSQRCYRLNSRGLAPAKDHPIKIF